MECHPLIQLNHRAKQAGFPPLVTICYRAKVMGCTPVITFSYTRLHLSGLERGSPRWCDEATHVEEAPTGGTARGL